MEERQETETSGLPKWYVHFMVGMLSCNLTIAGLSYNIDCQRQDSYERGRAYGFNEAKVYYESGSTNKLEKSIENEH